MMEEIIKKAREYALDEIDKFGTPKIEHFELSFEKGLLLAEKFEGNKDIVALGTILMDLKLGECIKENKIAEHVQRSSEAAQEFLKQFDIEEEVVKKIISCVESHHGVDEYYCLEAEICANADCYRFLSPFGIFNYLILLAGRKMDYDEYLNQLEYKMNEKYKTLSLDVCKEELTGYYLNFKDLIKEARTK